MFLVEWEGPEAIEVIEKPIRPPSEEPEVPAVVVWSSDDESVGSGDEYVEDALKGADGKPTRKVNTLYNIW
jgi:hypothetical protein